MASLSSHLAAFTILLWSCSPALWLLSCSVVALSLGGCSLTLCLPSRLYLTPRFSKRGMVLDNTLVVVRDCGGGLLFFPQLRLCEDFRLVASKDHFPGAGSRGQQDFLCGCLGLHQRDLSPNPLPPAPKLSPVSTSSEPPTDVSFFTNANLRSASPRNRHDLSLRPAGGHRSTTFPASDEAQGEPPHLPPFLSSCIPCSLTCISKLVFLIHTQPFFSHHTQSFTPNLVFYLYPILFRFYILYIQPSV